MSELDKYQVVSASLHHILFPLIEEVVQGDEQLERQLKLAFTKTEYTGNGFAHDFINGVIHFLKKLATFTASDYQIFYQLCHASPRNHDTSN